MEPAPADLRVPLSALDPIRAGVEGRNVGRSLVGALRGVGKVEASQGSYLLRDMAQVGQFLLKVTSYLCRPISKMTNSLKWSALWDTASDPADPHSLPLSMTPKPSYHRAEPPRGPLGLPPEPTV